MIDFEQWYEQEIGSENRPEYEAAKWVWEYQQKKLDCCREENKAHLEKIDELQARNDYLSKKFNDLARLILDECEDILKGNKDE